MGIIFPVSFSSALSSVINPRLLSCLASLLDTRSFSSTFAWVPTLTKCKTGPSDSLTRTCMNARRYHSLRELQLCIEFCG